MLRRTLITAMLVVLVLPTMASAQAQVLTPEKTDVIIANCSVAQHFLTQQQKRDAVARINYGRAYEGVSRQIGALNSRLAYNKVDAIDAVQGASDFRAAFDRFKASYNRYDDLLHDALRTDCQAKPVEFYNLLERARQERVTVDSDTAEISQILVNYRETLVRQQQAQLPQEGQVQ